MKEDPTKEDRMKQAETHNQSLNVSEDAGWARCPICNDVWRIYYFRYPFYAIWDVEHYDLPSGVIPEQPCPVHVDEIVVKGRAKGKRTILNQDQLKEMSENGLHCPVCKNKNLKLIDDIQETHYWTCKGCKASIITELSFTIDGNIEIKFCSFREDLGKRKPDKLFKGPSGLLKNGTYKLKTM
jgi:ribosomal protein L37AE/L43A